MSADDRHADDPGRREFARLAGFAVGGAALGGCTRGVEHGVMPYLVRPEEVTPGRTYRYASVCGACPAGCGILTENRDGRPIKLEGNPDHPVSAGGLCAIGQASVLAVYDSLRARGPLRDGKPATWDRVDRDVGTALAAARDAGRGVRFLTDSSTGPAERDAIASFLAPFGGRHVTYDPISFAAIADAHRATHGPRVVPGYRFDRARVIVGVGADFLGRWMSPVEHGAGYRTGRSLDGGACRFSYHVQLESRMTLTGSNADRRVVVPVGSAASIVAHLARELAGLAGSTVPWETLPSCPIGDDAIRDIAGRLWEAPRGRTLVVCGENDVAAQRVTNYVNHLLGNYGAGDGSGTLDLRAHATSWRGDDRELLALIDEIENGEIEALFVRGVNPLYDLPETARVERALTRVGLVVSFAERPDETAHRAHLLCPEPHFLEAWGDAEPIAGIAAIRQPALRSIGSTRPMSESLAAWSGRPASARDIVRAWWRRDVFPRRLPGSPASFETFWNRALHDGVVRVTPRDPSPAPHGFDLAAVTAPGAGDGDAPESGELRLELHASVGMLDGRHAHNPWLHELPEPIAKTVWDNFVAFSPTTAGALGIADGDVVRIAAEGADAPSIELPALSQRGQHGGTVAVALGYGRAGTDRFAQVGPRWLEGRPTVARDDTVGVNGAPLLEWRRGLLGYGGRRVRVERTGRRHPLVTTQLHHSLDVPAPLVMGDDTRRPIARETTLAAWRNDPGAGNDAHHDLATLWPDHEKAPHHWGMAIDLSACTGCSACVIACQAENNVPVVGRDEVRRAREMHWMRIDRYYGGDDEDVDVVHMPMMCQHCDNAPCETVCPVQATVQSAEGLNQQVYNRCVGTRYCANNCPYKVRRFNWFDYPREDPLRNLALNPDVTVRSRGVMEKCSLCVQRIQDAKAESKRTGRPLADGDIVPACAQSCPARAITFGDMKDPDGAVARLKHDPRHFAVLEELGIKPVVGYLTLVRNREEA